MTVQSPSAALREGLAHLSATEREVFDLLHEADGAWLGGRQIAGTIWPDDVEAGLVREAYGNLRSVIYRLRIRLAGSGWAIDSARGTGGYRLRRLRREQVA
jgi:DNA-binding response OmpR family regulator